MKEMKAVLFDLDNTLLDRTRSFRAFVKGLLRDYFSHVDEETAQVLFREVIEQDQDGYRDKRELFSDMRAAFPWQTQPELDELMHYYSTEYVKCAAAMEQALEVVSDIRQGRKTGIITNGKTVIQQGKIDKIGIREYFDCIVVSEEAGCKKPDPRIFEQALQQLQVKPQECLFIGDHPVNDIGGAAKLGMKTIWIQVNQPWDDRLPVKPLFTITHLGQLREIFT